MARFCRNFDCPSRNHNCQIGLWDNYCIYCGKKQIPMMMYIFALLLVVTLAIYNLFSVNSILFNSPLKNVESTVAMINSPTKPNTPIITSPTVTKTKTLIPTMTKTLTPTVVDPANILFSDNFEGTDQRVWDNRSSSPLEIRSDLGNSYLHFTASGLAYPGIWLSDMSTTWRNYAYEARVRLYNNGIIFCFYENDGSHYQAGLNMPGSVFFSDYVLSRSGEPYISFKNSSFPTSTNRWYLVRIEIVDNQLSMFIDGKIVLSAMRDTIPYGGIGVITGSEGNGEFDLDDIRVWKIE